MNWPLAALVAWRVAQRRSPLAAAVAVVVLLSTGAVAAWDPASATPLSRTAIAVTNLTLAVLFAIYPDGRIVPRWIVVPAAIEVALQLGNLASGFAWENVQPWWPAHFLVTWGLLLFGGQLYRYLRRSSVDERERTRWPLTGMIAMVLCSLRMHRQWALLDAFAKQHGGRAQALVYSDQPSEVLADRGEAGISRSVVTFPSGARIGDWEYVRAWAENGIRSAHTWGYVSIPLDNVVPHIVLDSRKNERANTLGAGADFSRSQIVSLEGDIDRRFTVYCPAGYGADALYFLTPDVMADLVDTAAEWDVEFIDDRVVFFRPGAVVGGSEESLGRLGGGAPFGGRAGGTNDWARARYRPVPANGCAVGRMIACRTARRIPNDRTSSRRSDSATKQVSVRHRPARIFTPRRTSQ